MSRRGPLFRNYFWLAFGSAVASILLSFTSLAALLDNDIYDFLFRLHPARPASGESAILAVDEQTLKAAGGMRLIRRTLAAAFEQLALAQPKTVAVDYTLVDPDPDEDPVLAAALAKLPNLVLACEMMPDGSRWQDPVESYRRAAKTVGHVGALPDKLDSVTRQIPLERVAQRERRWALSLEAFRLTRGAAYIDSSPTDISVAGLSIRSRWDEGRPMRVRFRAGDSIPRLSVHELLQQPRLGQMLRGKAVFVGTTAQSAGDRVFTPLSTQFPMMGVEVHAQAYETLVQRDFLESVAAYWPVLFALLAAAGVASAFSFLRGWPAYASTLLLLGGAHLLPDALFRGGWVLEPFAPVTSAWLASLACGSWQYLVVRRKLTKSETDRTRYQQAIHWVTHEMRTPLTAIQGSSELMARYNLPEEKRKQMGQMINSESRRLAKMITLFLDVERLSAGQMELRKAPIGLAELVAVCVERAQPLSEKKEIQIHVTDLGGLQFAGDRELMEYVVYNLVTNAIKYSPPGRTVEIEARRRGASVELAVRDQGIGMDEDDLKRLFQKFFRSERAVKSGETGTGLGLSIVDQIVAQHGGRIQVTSRPGEGSCFTVVLPGE